MKTLFKSLLAAAAAVVALAACQRQENDVRTDGGRTVRFLAGPVGTRTVFTAPDATGKYPVEWTANDAKVKVSLNFNSAVNADVTPNGATAKFEATFKTEGIEAPYTFYALSPLAAGISVSGSYKSWTVEIPADQTPSEGTPDEAAQVLAGVSQACASLDEVIRMDFSHVTAYGRLTLTNLDLAGTAVTGISLTAEKPLAGRFYYYVVDTDEHSAGEVVANTASNTVNLATTSLSDIWFACAPADLSGTALKVVVRTESGPVEKVITVPANRKFESGKIAKFSIDMTGATHAESKVYELVTDASQLTSGSEVIIANEAGDHAVSTTQNTNNRAATEVAVADNKITDPSETVEILAVEAGTAAGTFAFKGKNGLYLVAENGNNRLKSSETKTELGSFAVSIDAEGVATVNATACDHGNMRYNSSSALFNCYAPSSTTGTAVALYKLVGSGSDEPIFSATLAGADESGKLTVPASTESATIQVVANVDWSIMADSEAVSFSQTSGNSSATVEVNFPANTSDAAVVYTLNIESDLGEFEFVITQEAVVPVGESVYRKVTSVTSGKKYILAVFVDGKLQAAKPIASGSNYGYPASEEVSSTDGVIEARHSDLELTFATTTGGYTIAQPDGRYWAMTGTYNSINLYASLQESYVWTVNANQDGTVDITNVGKEKHFMYDTGRSNFAVYANFGDKNAWPALYEYIDGDTPVAETVATPAFSPAAGEVEAGTVVTISCATSGATIHYTTDGSTPTASSATGTSVTVNAAMTLKAIAVKEGMNDSAVATAAYTIKSVTPPSGDNYVKVTSITSGKKYIIVGGLSSKAMVPATLSSANRLTSQDVTITSGAIASTTETDALAVTISASGSGYTISYSNVYLVYPGSSTGLKTEATASSTWIVSAASASTGTFRFTTSNVETRALAFRAGSNNTFGAYATSNITGNEYFDIDLYELGGEGGSVNPTVPATVTFTNGTSRSMTVGETFSNPATTNSTATVTYSSSNTAVATVNAAGLITAVSSGTAVITASVAAVEGAFTAGQTTCNITVTSAPSGDEVIDLLTAADFKATGSATYVESTDVKKSSDAIYYGNSAKNYDAIQIRSKNNDSGIVSTTSGGNVKSVKIVLNSNTGSTREIQVYGSNSAYTNAADLYGENAGTLLGSVKMSDGTTGTVTVSGSYQYVGIRSKEGAAYLDSVEITWN